MAWALLIARTRRAAGVTALAAFAFALGPGPGLNTLILGGSAAVAKELVILAATVGVASVVLAEAHARQVRLSPTHRSGARG